MDEIVELFKKVCFGSFPTTIEWLHINQKTPSGLRTESLALSLWAEDGIPPLRRSESSCAAAPERTVDFDVLLSFLMISLSASVVSCRVMSPVFLSASFCFHPLVLYRLPPPVPVDIPFLRQKCMTWQNTIKCCIQDGISKRGSYVRERTTLLFMASRINSAVLVDQRRGADCGPHPPRSAAPRRSHQGPEIAFSKSFVMLSLNGSREENRGCM